MNTRHYKNEYAEIARIKIPDFFLIFVDLNSSDVSLVSHLL